MFCRTLIALLFAISAFQMWASNPNQFSEIPQIRSVSSFPVVYGWFQNNNKWTTKDNEIKNIDRFSNYYILSFFDQGKKYIAIVKEEKIKNELILNSYIIDYTLYESNIIKWEEHSVIKLPILKEHTTRIKKDEILTADILGIEGLSDLSAQSNKKFVLQYKFFSDSTVKFLFYSELYTDEGCIIGSLKIKKEYISLCKYLGKDELYDNFFYKTTIQYFTDFIDSPLKNN